MMIGERAATCGDAAAAGAMRPARPEGGDLQELPGNVQEKIFCHHLSARDLARMARSSRHLDAVSRAAPCWPALAGVAPGPAARGAAARAIDALRGPSIRPPPLPYLPAAAAERIASGAHDEEARRYVLAEVDQAGGLLGGLPGSLTERRAAYWRQHVAAWRAAAAAEYLETLETRFRLTPPG